MAEVKVQIERLCYGGAGVGRVDGKACFVPFTAPGDEVLAAVTREKSSYLEGELAELLSPAPCRVQAPCPIFGSCGGCNWQHVSYSEQLAQKGEIFADTLSRLGGVERSAVLPPTPSPCEYGYRSRIQLKVAHRGGEALIGFFRGGSHEVVDAPAGCPISDPVLNRVLSELRALVPRLPASRSISQCDLSTGDDGAAIVIIHCGAAALPSLTTRLQEERASLPSVHGLFLRSGAKTQPKKVFGIEELSYRIPAELLPGLPEVTLSFSRGGFSQVNYAQNLKLVRTAWEWGGFTGRERVLDLYCGNGNFSLPLARYLGEVVGVEGYAPSIADAKRNARANGIENARFFVSDAAQAVRRFADQGERFDLVLLDPPRSGAAGVADIPLLHPEKIIYVSCDPPTLARDLRLLGERGYRVVRSQPVDMFPQTYHLESVTLLKRDN